jgi:glycosyltransferase involved in cell wall biosynthesis
MAEPLGGYPAEDGGTAMNIALVSVIIPTYNYAHLIVETLESVRNQTYTHWECVIVDDGSTDETATVVQAFLEKHPDYNFKYVQTENGGTSSAKNKGISLAKGSLIQFLDADDLLSPRKLEIQVQQLQAKDTALVFSSSRFFRMKEGRQVGEVRYPEGFLSTTSLRDEELLRRLIVNNQVTIGSPLVRIDILKEAGGFDASLLNNEDWILWFKIALIHPNFTYDHHLESYVQIRLHDISAMNQHHKMFLGEVRVRQEMERLLLERELNLENTSLIKLNRDLLALHRVRSLEIFKGMSHIIGSFIRSPFSDYQLLAKGCYKLSVRAYKSLFGS